ncbi:MAG TPA: nicotinate-nucleotide--dimethylbenzimidazole phosphoribosyltransferase [Alphaproteobacteria bacterium]|nr:nicotinate-nucleotide--dimethylbenzimidazole phosphoribosyltransferase [Alphaproteobacteria bacterium]
MSDPNLDEIRTLIRELPGPDLEAATAVVQRQRQLTKPPGSLGRLEELVEWLATWQGRKEPQLRRPRVAVFAGNHGVAAARPVSAYPVSVTAQMVRNFIEGGAAINQLCQTYDADLRVYEMALEEPTADFTRGPAMSHGEGARAMAYGMMALEPGLDVLCLGEMGIGNSTAAAALACAAFGGEPEDWVGPGTGVDRGGLERKAAAVREALAANREALSDPLHLLCALGGHELLAICGAVLAARLAKTPVVLDGFACTAAAAVLTKADPRILDHCVVGHVSAEPGHRRLLERIGKRPLLDFGMRLGEGTGAALIIPLLRGALACHDGMATFGDAGVSGPV